MKLLVDMNLSPLWVPFLADHGIVAVHWSSEGEPTASDITILDHAAANGYVVFTHDLYFAELLVARRARAPSVIQVLSQDVLPAAIGEAVLRAIRATQSNLEAGALVTVDPTHQRIRLLPMK